MPATQNLSTPLSLPQKVIGTGAQIIDNTLGTASFYVEKIDHTIRGVPVQTEKFAGGFENELYSPVAQIIEAVREQVRKGLPVTLSLGNGTALINALTADVAGGLDDRKLLLEYGLTFLSRLPDSPISNILQQKVITLLWKDLPHPPSTYVGNKYKFRSADGSGYATLNPDLGKAGSNYSRSVEAQHPLPVSQLPSTSLLFDCLLKREAEVDHPAGLSSFFFAFANLVIHQVFNTDHEHPDQAINKTSSYIDLAIIYGNNQKEQDSVRARDGKGSLWPDTFADSRLLRMPPSTPALLVLLCRNHNFIASKLLAINERGNWNSDLSKLTPEKRKQQDEELFQTARLVNCGTVMNIVLSDYLSSILGLTRTGNSFSLDLLRSYREGDHTLSQLGQGNQISIEFTALYHFHATISAPDEEWVEASLRQLFPKAKTWDAITVDQYRDTIAGLLKKELGPPKTWKFGGLKRGADGYFPDEQLAEILKNAIEVPAGAFGARRTPHAMKIIEVMAMEQNREWGTCSLNEFRKFLALKPFSTFEEWNPREDIAEAARLLYGHPDNIELYVGLQAEASKPVVSGAGLCPGYTISRAILGDAAALVRGDRFLTVDRTFNNLTAWGFKDSERHPDNPAFGGLLPTLLMRALPGQWDPESIYTQVPMMVPSRMRTYLTEIGIGHKYNYDRPVSQRPVVTLKSYADAKEALKSAFLISAVPRNAQEILPGHGYLATFNRPSSNVGDVKLIRQAFLAGASVQKHVDFFARTSAKLIAERSYTLPGTTVTRLNVVKDVINLLPAHFVAEYVIGLPLKTPTHPVGEYYETELQEKLTSIYNFIFVEGTPFVPDAAYKITARDIAKREAEDLLHQVHHHFDVVGGGRFPFLGVLDVATHLLLGEPATSHEWLRRLVASKRDRSELANDVVALAAAVSAEFSQTLTNVVDVLLDDPYKKAAILLATSHSPESVTTLKGLIAEAIRLTPALAGVSREVTTDTTINGRPVFRGGQVFISTVDANYDPAAFDHPERIKLHRTEKPLLGDGLFRLLGEDWVVAVLYPVVKNIFSIPGVKRDTGVAGVLDGLSDLIPGNTRVRKYIDPSTQAIIPWAANLTVVSSASSPATIIRPVGIIGRADEKILADIQGLVQTLEGVGRAANGAGNSSSHASTPTVVGGPSATSGPVDGGLTAVDSANKATRAQPKWLPIFVGGVGGGANDPDYQAKSTPAPTPAPVKLDPTAPMSTGHPHPCEGESGSAASGSAYAASGAASGAVRG